jgi:hypothetical protein
MRHRLHEGTSVLDLRERAGRALRSNRTKSAVLKGEAKTAYMREYMRRKRAGLPTTKPKLPRPKAEWKPSQRIIDQIDHWRHLRAHRPWRLRRFGERVIDGLTLDTDESWMEACRRYEAYSDERRANREKEKQEAAEAAAKPNVRYCLFCNEPESTKRIFVGDGFWIICENCIAEAAAMVADQRKAPLGAPQDRISRPARS